MGKYGYNPGDIGWSELRTSDVDAATTFYSELVGVEVTEGPSPNYKVVKNGEEMIGGVTGFGEGGSGQPHWIPYFTVSDVDAVAAKIESMGGKILEPITEIPDMARYVVFEDPTGGTAAAVSYSQGPST